MAGLKTVPDNVENHASVRGIISVAMAVPSGGFEINLDVARDWQIVFELDDGSAKVWARFAIQETGMQHAQSPAVHEPELIPI